MNIEILSDGTFRSYELSKAMERHFSIPINHTQTILDQINNGMYSKWLDGKRDLVCIDFGANVGIVSLYLLPFCKKLICVEPTPSHFDLLTELLREIPFYGKGVVDLHKYGEEIIFYQNALTEKSEDVIFMTGHATENKITSADGYGNGKITVEGKPLIWFLNVMEDQVDFCKIDIEGGEIFALTEEQLKLAHGKVKTFFVECHPSNNYSMYSCQEELVKRFKNAGYRVEIIDYQTIVAYES